MKLLIKLQKHSVMMVVASAVLALLVLLKLPNTALLQFQVISVLILLYLSWALAFHHLDKTLTLEIALEYVLTALLALVILFGILT